MLIYNKSELVEKLAEMMEAYSEIKEYLRRNAKHEYDRWKAGGFLVDNDIVSMYPTLEKVVNGLYDDEHCENCGEDLDKGCDGNLRCPTCDDPCPGCSDQ